MQFQQQNINTYTYPIYNSLKDTTKGFLRYNYLNPKYKVNNDTVKHTQVVAVYKPSKHKIGNIKLVQSDIILFILLFLYVIVAYVKISSKNFIHRLSISLVNYSYSDSFYNEKNVFLKLYGYLLSFVFYIVYSLFLTTSIDTFFPNLIGDNWFFVFYIFIFFIFALNIIQYGFFIIFGYVFLINKIAKEHMFYVSNLIKFAGILFLIFISAIFFVDIEIKRNLIYLAILLSFVLYFFKIVRYIVIFLQNGFSILYMFLYFCAVEIIPVLLLVKILLLLIELNTSILDVVV